MEVNNTSRYMLVHMGHGDYLIYNRVRGWKVFAGTIDMCEAFLANQGIDIADIL